MIEEIRICGLVGGPPGQMRHMPLLEAKNIFAALVAKIALERCAVALTNNYFVVAVLVPPETVERAGIPLQSLRIEYVEGSRPVPRVVVDRMLVTEQPIILRKRSRVGIDAVIIPPACYEHLRTQDSAMEPLPDLGKEFHSGASWRELIAATSGEQSHGTG